MASEVEIYNMALAHVGVSERVANPTDNTKAANLCRAFYAHCVGQMLRDYPWPFARKRVALGLLSASAPTNWGYAYAYPADCAKALYLVTARRVPRPDERPAFEVCRVGSVKAICCDLEDAELVYTLSVMAPEDFDPQFTEALTYLIGSNIAMPMSAVSSIGTQCRQFYADLVSQASASAMNEGWDGIEPDGSWQAARQ